MNLCLFDLAQLTGGQLRLGEMPPREGELAEVRRICLVADEAQAGDVFWCLGSGPCDFELAFLRGALGVVGCRAIEPWPGRFSLTVDDAALALERLVTGLLRQTQQAAAASAKETLTECSELKDLQLRGKGGVAIFPPTCGQSSVSRTAKRCRRTAA